MPLVTLADALAAVVQLEAEWIASRAAWNLYRAQPRQVRHWWVRFGEAPR